MHFWDHTESECVVTGGRPTVRSLSVTNKFSHSNTDTHLYILIQIFARRFLEISLLTKVRNLPATQQPP